MLKTLTSIAETKGKFKLSNFPNKIGVSSSIHAAIEVSLLNEDV